MTTIKGKTYDFINFRTPGFRLSDMAFDRCTFNGCYFTGNDTPAGRPVVERITLNRCTARRCNLCTLAISDVTISDLKAPHILRCWACVFKHVTLRGRLNGTITFRRSISPGIALHRAPPIQKAFNEANAEFYKTVDWALDISEAETTDFEFNCIPVRLVRRDPETQVIVTRERILASDWQSIPDSELHLMWKLSLEALLNSKENEEVFIAPKGLKRDRDILIKGLHLLRKLGIAEPD